VQPENDDAARSRQKRCDGGVRMRIPPPRL
jgi:hypothetical protein